MRNLQRLETLAGSIQPRTFDEMLDTITRVRLASSQMLADSGAYEIVLTMSDVVLLFNTLMVAVRQSYHMGLINECRSTREMPTRLRDAFETPEDRVKALAGLVTLARFSVIEDAFERHDSEVLAYELAWILEIAPWLGPIVQGLKIDVDYYATQIRADVAEVRRVVSEYGQRLGTSGLIDLQTPITEPLTLRALYSLKAATTRAKQDVDAAIAENSKVREFVTAPANPGWVLKEYTHVRSGDSVQTILRQVLHESSGLLEVNVDVSTSTNRALAQLGTVPAGIVSDPTGTGLFLVLLPPLVSVVGDPSVEDLESYRVRPFEGLIARLHKWPDWPVVHDTAMHAARLEALRQGSATDAAAATFSRDVVVTLAAEGLATALGVPETAKALLPAAILFVLHRDPAT